MVTKKTAKMVPGAEPVDTDVDLVGGFRQRLYQLRRRKEWSQSEVARQAWGVVTDGRGYEVARNRDRISAYEAGRDVPTRENLEKLAEVFGVTVAELAPDLVLAGRSGGRSMEKPAAFEMKVLHGTNEAHIKVDAVVAMSVAVQIAAILQDAV